MEPKWRIFVGVKDSWWSCSQFISLWGRIPCWGPGLQGCQGAEPGIWAPRSQACCTSICPPHPPWLPLRMDTVPIISPRISALYFTLGVKSVKWQDQEENCSSGSTNKKLRVNLHHTQVSFFDCVPGIHEQRLLQLVSMETGGPFIYRYDTDNNTLNTKNLKKERHLLTFDRVVRPGVSSKIYKKHTHMYWLLNAIIQLEQKRRERALTICLSSSVRTPRARDRVVCTFLDTANTLKK